MEGMGQSAKHARYTRQEFKDTYAGEGRRFNEPADGQHTPYPQSGNVIFQP